MESRFHAGVLILRELIKHVPAFLYSRIPDACHFIIGGIVYNKAYIREDAAETFKIALLSWLGRPGQLDSTQTKALFPELKDKLLREITGAPSVDAAHGVLLGLGVLFTVRGQVGPYVLFGAHAN